MILVLNIVNDNKMADTMSRYPPVENYSCDKNGVKILAVKYCNVTEMRSSTLHK